MITRKARKALRAKRSDKPKTVSGIDVNDPWLNDNSDSAAQRQKAFDDANRRHPLPISGSKMPSVIQIWEDLHNERAGYYRAYWCNDSETSIGSPVVGYCSPGGSHKTIKAAVAECRRLGYDDPIYRNGRQIA